MIKYYFMALMFYLLNINKEGNTSISETLPLYTIYNYIRHNLIIRKYSIRLLISTQTLRTNIELRKPILSMYNKMFTFNISYRGSGIERIGVCRPPPILIPDVQFIYK